MTTVMKYLILPLLIFFTGCSKGEDVKPRVIINRIAGNYTCLKYSYDIYTNTFYDTVLQYPFSITRASDTSLFAGNEELFYWDYSPYDTAYVFLNQKPVTSNEHSLYVSQSLRSFRYRHKTGGLGGGTITYIIGEL